MCVVLILSVVPQMFVFASDGGQTSASVEVKNNLYADVDAAFDFDCKSYILIEAATGKVMLEKNADEALPPASVTKVMTLLLVMEAVDGGVIGADDIVSISEYAASMGGSQVYLEPGEQMSVNELLKCVIIASANDAAVALAEYVAGSEEGFIVRMNERAKQLGMNNTYFENATGLDDNTTNHLTSARDIALMSAELMKHEAIFKYTTIWMDSIRDGAFGLTNTNRLIRFYNGANGLKTGSTSKAKFCISAAAKRDGMQLIAVIMGAPTRDTRNEIAKKLLDYGFANYKYFVSEEAEMDKIKVLGGVTGECGLKRTAFDAVLSKSGGTEVEEKIILPEYIAAPVKAGDIIGTVEYYAGGEQIGTSDITATEDVDKISYSGLLGRLIKRYFLGAF